MHRRLRVSSLAALALLLSLATTLAWWIGTVPEQPPVPAPERWFSVVAVIDGDTIVVQRNDERYTVRLLGIDTPEMAQEEEATPECFAREATRRTKALLRGRKVRLETDSSQAPYDQYGRLLAYVHTREGVMINEALVREGFAREYTFKGTSYRYQLRFKDAEAQARTASRGIWSPDNCARF